MLVRDHQTASQDGHDLLIRAGFLRQAHSGIFHILPLGTRVLEKIERLIDKHMRRLGASKVSLSSLSSEALWRKSGRLDKGRGSELFRLQDRKGAKYLLTPTHEEEITALVADAVHSFRNLPLKLYQVSRKYRDEARPRQGLLRGREFLMKDLYTFDVSEDQAIRTYAEVRKAYVDFLDELRLPYLTASADSGNMGGSLSHEYHFASDSGEDTIISCDRCDYSINEELYIGRHDIAEKADLTAHQEWIGISKDRRTLVRVHYPLEQILNLYAVKAVYPEIDTSVEDPLKTWSACRDERHSNPDIDHPTENSGLSSEVTLRDPRLAQPTYHDLPTTAASTIDATVLLTAARTGDTCPNCHNPHALRLRKAVEIGHTFHLSTRYSIPLSAEFLNESNKRTPISMGCHGLGVSRIVGAVASLLADSKGLNWPLAIAPFGAVMVTVKPTAPEEVHALYDDLTKGGTLDVAIDDRPRLATGWRLNDADLIGYPFIIVLGKAWAEGRKVELQCRRLGVKEEVPAAELVDRIEGYAAKL